MVSGVFYFFLLETEIPVDGLRDIAPGQTKKEVVFLDATAPELCKEIVVKASSWTRSFSCGNRIKVE